jgi:hypothetical protein
MFLGFFKGLFKPRHRGHNGPSDAQFHDYMPLFFYDKGLSPTAKVIMCLMSGNPNTRKNTLDKLRSAFPETAVDGLEQAIVDLEKYGYLSSESYKGEYGEPRVDQRICICPQTRLPRIYEPHGCDISLQKTASEMYNKASDLGFIAETGKDTTYLLYDAMRIFGAVESLLTPDEFVVFPLIGPESYREGLADQSILREYPHCILGAIVTTERVIFCQEDCSAEGRRMGMARFICKEFYQLATVSMDEKLGRVTFRDQDKGWDSEFSVDVITPFGVEFFQQGYEDALSFLPTNSKMPRLSFQRDEEC